MLTLSAIIGAVIALIQFRESQKTLNWIGFERFENRNATIQNTNHHERMGFKLSFRQRFEKQYCASTGLWQVYPNLKAWHLFIVCFITGIGLGHFTWGLFRIEGLVVSGFILGFIAPLQALMLWKAYRFYQLTCSLPSFYGVLLRWAQIQPDIYFCFGQLAHSGLPLRVTEPFTKFLRASTGGVSKETAFAQLSQKLEETPLENFIRCLERLIDHRGDLPKLLQGFEDEAYQLQYEVTKRKMTQLKYKLLINGLCAGSFVLIYGLLRTNRVLSSFYAETWMGKSLLSALSGLLVLSFLGGLRYDSN